MSSVSTKDDALLLTRDDLHAELTRFVREDLQTELKSFMEVSFADELRKLGDQTYKDLHESLQTLIGAMPQRFSPQADGISSHETKVDLVLPGMKDKRKRSEIPDTKRHSSADSKRKSVSDLTQNSIQTVLDLKRNYDSPVMTAILPGETDFKLESPNSVDYAVGFDPMTSATKHETFEDDVNGVGYSSHNNPSLNTPLQQLGSLQLSEDSVKFKEPRMKNHYKKSKHEGFLVRLRETMRNASATLHQEPDWKHIVRRIVRNDHFDYFMGLFLIANAISIGAQTNYMAHQSSSIVPTGFRLIMGLFCIIFTVELTLRIICHGNKFFSHRMKGWQWNFFDIFVVTVQIADEVTQIILSGADETAVLDNAGALRLLRIFRVIRLIRMVRLIPELKNMVYLIFASMWSFVWTAVLLLLMMYVFAVYYTEISTDLRHDHGDNGHNIDEIQENWGSLGSSMFSLFMAITGGDDWYNFVKGFQGHAYFLHTIIFCCYVGFAVLVMLNLVTGVFVEGAQRIVQEDKDNDLVRQVCKLFAEADMDGDHCITWERFQENLHTQAMADYFAAVDLNVDEAKALFQLLDTDDSGSLTIDEFVQGCLRLKGPAKSVDLASLVLDLKLQWRTQRDRWAALDEQLNMVNVNVHKIMKTLPRTEASRPTTAPGRW